jgi:hypothetical protein
MFIMRSEEEREREREREEPAIIISRRLARRER